jgi:hypothetical protein
MARPTGFEPVAYCLEGSCSIQLSYERLSYWDMERVMGIEPTRPAWKAGILPLNYTRMSWFRMFIRSRNSRIYYNSSFQICQLLFFFFKNHLKKN